jgi:rhodanese-related sulfurtransferase
MTAMPRPKAPAASPALSALLQDACPHRVNNLPYAGEVTPSIAYEFLRHHGGLIVDVRTTPEWQFIGVPDLSATPGRLLTISWKTYPTYMINPQFAETLAADEDVTLDTPLFFLCRSGGRSLDAAVAMTAEGYRYCFNVEGGFEGEPDATGQRGRSQGWKAAQLPWKQG